MDRRSRSKNLFQEVDEWGTPGIKTPDVEVPWGSRPLTVDPHSPSPKKRDGRDSQAEGRTHTKTPPRGRVDTVTLNPPVGSNHGPGRPRSERGPLSRPPYLPVTGEVGDGVNDPQVPRSPSSPSLGVRSDKPFFRFRVFRQPVGRLSGALGDTRMKTLKAL